MIYLNAEVISGLGEDTFWTWFNREIKNTYIGLPKGDIKKDDTVLQYSTLGKCKYPQNTISLLWELHPEMKCQLQSNEWDGIINKIEQCAISSYKRVVSSELMVPFYRHLGKIDILPIGVDTLVFKPQADKNIIRKKYNIPVDKKVIFWGGTTHPMKGFNNLIRWKEDNPDCFYIVVWKQKGQNGYLPGALNLTHISQVQLSELMGCSDNFMSCGLLRPFFMIEWEAMACDIKPIILNGIVKDFMPSLNPRDDIFRLKWDRNTAKRLWEAYIGEIDT